MKMTYAIAEQAALRAGATLQDIERETKTQAYHVGSLSFKHMIKALSLCTAMNTREEWVRLAAALKARSQKGRKGVRK